MCLISKPVCAEDLMQVYELAAEYDALLKQAAADLRANRQALPQAIAKLLPVISGQYTTTDNNGGSVFTSASGNYNTRNYGFNLTQSLYEPSLWANVIQSDHQVKAALANYLSQEQNLILRVAEQYFNVLKAQDNLTFSVQQRKAFARQLEQTQQRFEVGLIPITDVNEAQARHDDALAREVRANNEVANAYEVLREIVYVPVHEIVPFPVSKKLPLVPPTPNKQDPWVAAANLHNLDVISATEAAKQAKTIIGLQASGHSPNVSLSGTVERFKNAPPFDDVLFARQVSLRLNIPIFEGGAVLSRTKEARARYDEASQVLESVRRSAISNTRQAFRGVLTRISEVEAIAQSVVSNKSALEATQAAYEVGTRTIVDVLDAKTDLLLAERNHASSRYDYLLEGLRLKQAAGILEAQDLYNVNQLIIGN